MFCVYVNAAEDGGSDRERRESRWSVFSLLYSPSRDRDGSETESNRNRSTEERRYDIGYEAAETAEGGVSLSFVEWNEMKQNRRLRRQILIDPIDDLKPPKTFGSQLILTHVFTVVRRLRDRKVGADNFVSYSSTDLIELCWE